ncbi:hypothetical protein F441_09987 [Phytophthora nicotianae CJ01A1]|uniref:Uncharacterized protein n=5 Tax=Phytophthora nicotianae TaxID=4792 RepID=W2R9W2_PHYN3|nr:hypothetical protein PPTG_21076 [Phytophthora nicotianae INRA-310]ETI57086.1 hypothetical protein F443_00556 [Phytophthora nicotianae P1569]ETK85317.1 hypothetical protein L915_09839 [Phytophthora nicotianae]ETO73952.1 hypothetical protein F444_10142 [Phytophthora nicotianae P1976]ETP15127.1 hypothetical protein F441_09987 [Phytophthora nicotianae CJ01A1]ETL38743.1 hypothetical protein L916_09745 [Phytophthora nicotianae]
MTVKIPSTQPPIALVKIDRGASATAMRSCSDTNIFPLFFDSQAFRSCDISLPGNVSGIPRVLSVKIQQFPLVCAVASTVYKVQGETLDSMVVTEWRSQNGVANKKEQPYLQVSQVTSRYAFTALEPLTNDIIAWARPSKSALDEEARLEQLCGMTLAKLSSTSLT